MKGVDKMEPFTYKKYIYYKTVFQKEGNDKYYILCDVQENYKYMRKEVNNPHDKIFKEVLDNKKEVVKFLNEMLKLKGTKYILQEKDVEKYNREFITENFHKIESDVVYKKNDQNIFFLIEQQSTIDYAMPYRILKYNMAIMESAIDREKLRQKNYKLPTIFSFVIYTGNKKWNATNYLVNKQEKLIGCKSKTFANFQVIDINNYTKKELLESESLLTKMMLLEKAKSYEELESYLQTIVENRMDCNQRIFFQRLIKYIFRDKLNNQKLNKFIKELQLKQEKGGDTMFVEIISKKIDEVFEMEEKVKKQETKVKEQETKVKERETKVRKQKAEIKQEKAKIEQKEKEIKQREKAINTAENQMIIKMLKNNIDESTILKIADIDKNRLAKIKKDNNFVAVN